MGAEYVQKALHRIVSTSTDGFGVFDKKWMPYPPSVVVVAAILYHIDKNRLDSVSYKALKKWYWGSVFGERYQSAVESTTARDYKELHSYISNPNDGSKLFQEIDIQITNNPYFTFLDVYRISAKYKGIMNLLALHGARDFRLQDNIQFHELDDHHIFPQAYLRKLNGKNGNSKYKDNEINSIVNKTLISASTNRKISKKSPSSYLKDDSIISQSDTQDILKRHFINKETYEYMLNDDYDSFLIARNELIVRLVRSLLEI